MRRTAEDVIEIGNALIRQKDLLPHGMFLPWIETESEMGQRTAYNFTGVAEKYGGKLATVASLSPTAPLRIGVVPARCAG
jgi:hypothetical protein